MATAIVQHRVEDFNTWKQAYDAHEGRKKHGFRDKVLQVADDPNNVVIILETDNLEGLQEFLRSDDLKAAMGAAGVIGQPNLFVCS